MRARLIDMNSSPPRLGRRRIVHPGTGCPHGTWTGALRRRGGNGGFSISGEADGLREPSTTALPVRVAL